MSLLGHTEQEFSEEGHNFEGITEYHNCSEHSLCACPCSWCDNGAGVEEEVPKDCWCTWWFGQCLLDCV